MVGVARGRRRVRYAIVGLYAAYVLVVSVTDPGTAGPAVAGPLGLVDADRWLHGLTYGTLAILLGWAGTGRRPRTLALVVLVPVAFGGAIELIQGPLAHRSRELGDAIANAAGASLGAVAWWLAARLRHGPAVSNR